MARFDTGADRRHAVVVGGGFAGAAAATALAEAGVAVTLVEERGTLGGRTSSYRDGVTRQDVDNGQHLFLGAYRDTRAFLRRLKVENRLRWLPGASTEFYARSGKKSVLNPGRLPGALGFLRGVLGFGALTWRDKASLLYGLTRLR
jgi:zeta-carotene desaturase